MRNMLGRIAVVALAGSLAGGCVAAEVALWAVSPETSKAAYEKAKRRSQEATVPTATPTPQPAELERAR